MYFHFYKFKLCLFLLIKITAGEIYFTISNILPKQKKYIISRITPLPQKKSLRNFLQSFQSCICYSSFISSCYLADFLNCLTNP